MPWYPGNRFPARCYSLISGLVRFKVRRGLRSLVMGRGCVLLISEADGFNLPPLGALLLPQYHCRFWSFGSRDCCIGLQQKKQNPITLVPTTERRKKGGKKRATTTALRCVDRWFENKRDGRLTNSASGHITGLRSKTVPASVFYVSHTEFWWEEKRQSAITWLFLNADCITGCPLNRIEWKTPSNKCLHSRRLDKTAQNTAAQ